MDTKRLPKITFWRVILIIILALGLYSTFRRFVFGLGDATHMTDQFPWGIWIGFDVITGVGLGAGGFVITAIVYIFNLERYKPIVRPAVLTAFFGYVLVVVGLLYDLGQPHRIWHLLIYWNHHSVLFEVGWCVMTYTTVLALEFSGYFFEKMRWTKLVKIQHAAIIPLVILGVILSTMHQSSLGSLFLIFPDKVHPLWYTPMLPLFFYISCIAVGFAMVIFESFLSARAFKKQLEFDLLVRLSRILAVILAFYFLFKIEDLIRHGAFMNMFEGSYESWLFLAEIMLGVLLPAVLLFIPKVRNNPNGMFTAVCFAVFGFAFGRMNVAVTSMEKVSQGIYMPAWTEWMITIFLVAVGFTAFAIAVKYLPIFPKEELPMAYRGASSNK
jgi:Ni/Fe-hydrogenase subunit HybB-like protein